MEHRDLELVFVRHAQPEWEPEGKACDDPALTPFGEQQAQAVAQWLGGEAFTGFYASPTMRTRATAAPLAQRWAREPQILDWLEEIRTPRLAGTPEEEVAAFLATARSRPLSEWWEGLPGGESFSNFHTRVTTGLESFLGEQLQARRAGPELWTLPSVPQRVVVIAHLGTISVILGHLLGIPAVPWEWERFPLSWAGSCVVRANPVAGGHLWSLAHFNQTHHLEHLA